MLNTLAILISLLAQGSPNASTDLQPKDRAQALLKEGSALYKQADFAAALQKFEAAYAEYPSPKLQFNIAQADRELGRIVEAVEAFETFLMQAPDAAPEIVAQARQSLAELKPKLAQLRIDVAAGTQVTIDERSVGFTPLARIVWVVPGRHRIAIAHPNYLPASLEVTVSAGEIRTVTPALLRAGETTAPAPSVPLARSIVAATPPAPPGEGAFSRKPWYVWTAAAATVVFTGGALVAGLSANAKYSDLENGCNRTIAGCSSGQIDAVKSRATLANLLWILAGASAVATGITLYIDNREAGASVALRF